MILLILLLAVCDAVHLNSNYFQSDFIVPTDCTIQPTQQECMEYAQLTMTPDIAYLEVSSGEPASLGVEVTFGGPDGSMTQEECYAAAAAKGITDASAWDYNGWPLGCVKTGSNQYRWNTVDGGTLCSSTYPCIQKSPTAHAYVTKAECQQYAGNINRPFYDMSYQSHYANGCTRWLAGNDIYWNENPAASANSCGQAGHRCIQKHSYYNFGHVQVTAGAAALESDIRHVSEKECEVYANSIGLAFTAHDDAAITGFARFSDGGCYCTSHYGGVDPGAGAARYTREWSTANGVASTEACRDLCYNLQEAKAVQGCSRLPVSTVRSDISESDVIVYLRNSYYDPPIQCNGNNFAGVCIQRDVITHHVAAEGCISDNGEVRWNIPFLEVSSGSPALEGSAAVSQKECKVYAASVNKNFALSGSTYAPAGCIVRYDYDGVQYNTNIGSKIHGGTDFDICGYEWRCIQKPMTELPCAPHQCICKRGNVVTTTYEAGVLSDRFFEYVEVSSGSPALEGSAAVSQKECKVYAASVNKNFALSGSTYAPAGCIVRYDYDGVQYNTNIGSKIHGATDFDICGYEWRCIQKVIKTHKFIEVSTGMPATFAVEVSSGKNDGSFSVEECEAYANTISGSNWDTYSGTDRPNGCYHSGSSYRFAANGNLDCGTGTDICIQKSPTALAYVSQSECERYASSNWDVDSFTHAERPSGCFLHTNGKYYYNSQSTTVECSSTRPCIQKAPFHAQSVQSIVKQAIDAVLHAEMHYAESVNVFIEDFDHPKTTASDTLYTKQASYEVTDFNFLYSTITANEEWRPALQFNTLEEAKVSCSADSSNCLGVTHRHLGGVDLYLRHNGNSHSQLANHDQEHDERLYFQLLNRPFFIRFPIVASTVVNSDLKALCDSYPSCFARGNYVNTHDAEWSTPGHTSGNYIAVFYKQFQLQQATKVNAVYTSPVYVEVTSGSPDGSVTLEECQQYAGNINRPFYDGTSYQSHYANGCTRWLAGNEIYWNENSAASANSCGQAGHHCIQKKYVSVDTLYEAFQGCNASATCEGITGYQDVTIGAAATQTVLLDQDLLINDGDDFQLLVYDFQTGDCAGSGGDYTFTVYFDKDPFEVLEACHYSSNIVTNPASFFGKRVLKKTAVATETCSEDCTSLGYKVSQFTDTHCLCTQKVATSGHNIKTDCFPGFELKDGACQPCPAGTTIKTCDKVKLYDGSNLDGTMIEIEKGNQNLWSFNDVVSSVVVPYPCKLELYQHGNFGGAKGTFFAGSYSGAAFTSIFSNNDASSVKVMRDGTTSASGCDLCPAGSDSVPYSSECFSCPDGESSVPGGRCTNCNAGQFQAGGSGCTNCNAGLYQNENGAAVCKSCPIGSSSNAGSDALTDCNLCTAAYYLVGNTCTICPGGKTSQALASSCTNCEIGRYGQSGVCSSCQAGKYQNEQGKSLCKLCPQGSYLTTTGADSSDDCTSCTAGKYNANQGSTSNVCTNCPAGTISAARAPGCSNCPEGQFQASSGQSSCEYCPKGQYQPANGQTSCFDCAAGKYNGNTGGTHGLYDCTNCAAGTYSSKGAASCTNCAAGRYSSAAAATCTDCAGGTYQPSVGQSSCLNCDAGQYSGQQATACSDCAVGQYSGVGLAACLNCWAGQYQNENGKENCKDCSVGTWSNSGFSTCTNCDAGFYQNENAAGGFDVYSGCKSCVAGTYSSSGASSCATCPSGTYSAARAETCTDCAAGTYQNEIAKGTCKDCAAGQFQDDAATTSCKDCPSGDYQSQTGKTGCIECPVGQYQNSAGGVNCKSCEKGKFADLTGYSSCLSCNSGQYQDETGKSECKTPLRCWNPTGCQLYGHSECHTADWARSCTYGSNTNNCRFSHYPNGCVGNGHGDVSSASSSHYALTKTGYENCYYYCWQRHQGVSDGFFQISAHKCYCYASGCTQNGGSYTFKMNC